MSKRFAIAILPKEKQVNGVKYALKIEKPSALGNTFGFTAEELTELWLEITKVLDTTKQ